MSSRYLMVLPVPAARVAPGKFAIESAFAQHLRLLKKQLGSLADELVLAVPELPDDSPLVGKLEEVDEQAEGIFFEPLHDANVGRLGYMLALRKSIPTLYREVKKAAVVHAGNSTLYRPLEFTSLIMGRAKGKKTISVTDIDQRNSAKMNYTTGTWSFKEYLVTKIVHDTWEHFQQSVGVRLFDLVLLKGRALADDYGAGRNNVQYFLDSAYSSEHIIPPEKLVEKKARIESGGEPLKFVYFGRLVDYKGLPDMIEAIVNASKQGAQVCLKVIGNGPDLEQLQALVATLGGEDVIEFVGSLSFGPELFNYLYACDVLMAAPQSEDTPRSALDAIAAGMPLLAYDTYYYKELDETGAPVTLVPWLDKEQLAAKIVDLDKNRAALAQSCDSALGFATENTQEKWLDKRIAWTKALAPATV